MTIVEALKTSKIDRITNGNRWLYWADSSQYGVEQNHWIVRESKRGRNSPVILIITDDESQAVKVLIGDIDET